MVKQLRGSFVALFGLTFFFPAGSRALADERILSFHSGVVVQADGSLIVTEQIAIRAERKEINRGIYRDFPTVRRDPGGRFYRVGFEVLEVFRDERPEDYHLDTGRNFVRVYVGHQDRYLNRGEYTYTLRYRTTHQIGSFADYDEVYWNVTGNDWAFPIDRVSCLVTIPGGENPAKGIQRYEAFTGKPGATGTDFAAELITPSQARFETTRPLARKEGLSFRVSFPKGLVREADEELEYLFWQNWGTTVALVGFLLVVLYYILVWFKVGVDPPKGVIRCRREPPEGFSPEALRYIRNMGYDNQVFSCALINMASKGYLIIDKRGDDYVLERDWEDESVLTEEEEALADVLFAGRSGIEITRSNRNVIGGAIKAFREVLKRKYRKPYFATNDLWLFPGVFVLAIAVVAAILGTARGADGWLFPVFFVALWLSLWTAGLYPILKELRSAWTSGSSSRAKERTLLAVPFVGAEIFVIVVLYAISSALVMALLLGAVILTFLFHHLIQAPTPRGRNLLNELEGFEMHLAGENRSPLVFTSREDATSVYEEFLPYAVALGRDDEWTREFTESIGEACRIPATHQPVWCRAFPRGGEGTACLGAALSAGLAGAAASASSSGGGSGGGGGGGGGGGW